MLAPAYALPMVDIRVVAIICVWTGQQWLRAILVGAREVGRTVQDSRLEIVLRIFEVGKRRDGGTSDTTDRKSGGDWQ
jgi:hypothetical protein